MRMRRAPTSKSLLEYNLLWRTTYELQQQLELARITSCDGSWQWIPLAHL